MHNDWRKTEVRPCRVRNRDLTKEKRERRKVIPAPRYKEKNPFILHKIRQEIKTLRIQFRSYLKRRAASLPDYCSWFGNLHAQIQIQNQTVRLLSPLKDTDTRALRMFVRESEQSETEFAAHLVGKTAEQGDRARFLHEIRLGRFNWKRQLTGFSRVQSQSRQRTKDISTRSFTLDPDGKPSGVYFRGRKVNEPLWQYRSRTDFHKWELPAAKPRKEEAFQLWQFAHVGSGGGLFRIRKHGTGKDGGDAEARKVHTASPVASLDSPRTHVWDGAEKRLFYPNSTGTPFWNCFEVWAWTKMNRVCAEGPAILEIGELVPNLAWSVKPFPEQFTLVCKKHFTKPRTGRLRLTKPLEYKFCAVCCVEDKSFLPYGIHFGIYVPKLYETSPQYKWWGDRLDVVMNDKSDPKKIETVLTELTDAVAGRGGIGGRGIPNLVTSIQNPRHLWTGPEGESVIEVICRSRSCQCWVDPRVHEFETPEGRILKSSDTHTSPGIAMEWILEKFEFGRKDGWFGIDKERTYDQQFVAPAEDVRAVLQLSFPVELYAYDILPDGACEVVPILHPELKKLNAIFQRRQEGWVVRDIAKADGVSVRTIQRRIQQWQSLAKRVYGKAYDSLGGGEA